MRRRNPMVGLGLLAVWLIGQMPWVLGFLVMLHGSHEATAAQCNQNVVVVFSHQSTESEPEHNHNDHVISFSIAENYLRRATPDGGRVVFSAPLLSFCVLLAPEIGHDAAVQTILHPDHAPPRFALRTVVLMV